jgi:UDP-N-acetylmuramoyl-L-alanyl-D-glutamate--2,6-diaminopimelate ligase
MSTPEAPPPRPEWLVGVTGTNGKTTTASLVDHLLRAAGWRVALATTVGTWIDGEPREGVTAFRDVLRAGDGCRAVVQETTSFSLGRGLARIAPFDAGVFTNLTHDHLDQHGGSYEHYLAAKAQLFLSLARSPRPDPVAVLPAAAPATPLLAEILDPRVRRVTWGWAEDGPADVEGAFDAGGLSIRGVRAPSALVGRHLAENVLAAVAFVVEGAGVPLADALAAVATFPPVPGRFEVVNPGGAPAVVVDYAHSPDALQRTLEAARGRVAGRVWLVFGCGGERDAEKRPVMGRIAASMADRVVLTTDNPRGEDPRAIAAQVRAGIGDRPVDEIDDRASAIAHAIRGANPADLVLIAGKGHERTQALPTGLVPFDDRAAAIAALADRLR